MSLENLSKKELIAIIKSYARLVEHLDLEQNSQGSADFDDQPGYKGYQPLFPAAPEEKIFHLLRESAPSDIVRKLVEIEKLEMVSHLAASISHEVRNPLTVSRGFIQLSLEDRLNSQVRNHYINTAIEELDRATEIINDYLTFAKKETNEKGKTTVSKEIQRVINILAPLANMNNVEISLSLTKNDHYLVCSEGRKLEQLLVNIIKNSIEAMPNGGKIQIDLTDSPSDVQINIQDEGIGMTQAQINRLGEPYFTTKAQGTGLGMMVSFRILKEMNGKISVLSEVGEGTNWKISLPIRT
ncbi:HAMP domain-containing histidine kinase [Domibacillus indicus]|uniref:sensor histidine kinase n=1 Tax=Domibacillus indicus TaxID=1437523 RepID=UPI00204130DE|nr:HAMP domain-containing sensor histidine kinase [Domibacillus indicus]MCM3791178.1 HAMP domain-containing histidine kinase [Domibacillus indicus]